MSFLIRAVQVFWSLPQRLACDFSQKTCESKRREWTWYAHVWLILAPSAMHRHCIWNSVVQRRSYRHCCSLLFLSLIGFKYWHKGTLKRHYIISIIFPQDISSYKVANDLDQMMIEKEFSSVENSFLLGQGHSHLTWKPGSWGSWTVSNHNMVVPICYTVSNISMSQEIDGCLISHSILKHMHTLKCSFINIKQCFALSQIQVLLDTIIISFYSFLIQ